MPSFPRPTRPRLPGPRLLIVNGDDFGLTDGITQGIIDAWRYGILTSTTAMVNLPGAPQRLARAHRSHPGLPIGLHLDVVYGRPVLPPEQVPSLVDDQGRFFPLLALVSRLPQVSLEELRLECFAQAELLLRTGITFDHIDCHQGMPAAYAPFGSLMVNLARHYRVPLRNPVPASTYALMRPPWSSSASNAVLALLRFAARHPRRALSVLPHLTPASYKRSAAALDRQGIHTTNWFVDAFFQRPDAASLVALIEQLPPGVSELMCHPGYVDEDLRQSGDGYVAPRAAELAALQDLQVRDALRRCQVKLVDFSFLCCP